MPYIAQANRTNIELMPIGEAKFLSVGELNYAITVLVGRYMGAYGKSYGTINDIMGVIESAKSEFYRRVAAPYENQKAFENGDLEVYEGSSLD